MKLDASVFPISLSQLKSPDAQNVNYGVCAKVANETVNPRREFLKSNQFGPLPLPFSTDRLTESQTQSLFSYQQASSQLGSFVLMNTDNLPPGAQVTIDNTDKSTVSIKLVGDIGLKGSRQTEVAKSIEYSVRHSKKNNHHPLVLVVGDWVYPRGPVKDTRKETERTQKSVLNSYQGLTRKCSVRGVLGNHEYGDNQKAADPALFMALAKKNNITVDRYGRYTIEAANFAIDVLSIDSTTIAVDDKQVEWIINEIANSLEREEEQGKKIWRVVVSHHPIVSYGLHAGETTYLGHLFDNKNIDFWLSGHEHDIEVIPQGIKNPPTIVSGTGSAQREIEPNPNAAFLTNDLGFIDLEITKDDIQVDLKLIKEGVIASEARLE